MRVAIIGAGAAGLMCAATLQETHKDVEVLLIERNDGLGKKVIISGGGRCNVTTGIRDVRNVLKHYPRGSKFLTSAMHGFPPDAVYNWFEAHDVPLKTQQDLRVFPISDNGRDIVHVFERLFFDSKVQVLLKTHAERVEKNGDQFAIFLKNQEEPLIVDKLVLTTGGQAYRHTGSTGDGYAFAQSLGHNLTPLAPSLNAFFTREKWPAEISGLSFEHAAITAKRKKQHTFTGPFLFTHKGVSGPAVFALSSLVAFEVYDKATPLNITIDLFPDQSIEQLRTQLQSLIDTHGHKQLKTILGLLVPKSLVDVFLTQLSLSGTIPANQSTKKTRDACLTWLKAIPLTVIARGAGDEFVTAGGIPLSEINPSTMESTLCKGLYIAGELLDVDGYTGGFNLQASWATGHLAGSRMMKQT
ncbi:aminoacetone oxidase family FAD-binding enzyme [Candidatus Uhrbacteria bacterium]|nr:aminoacetone oxidase family FAD-binding enzyme [Candidatus Uhrbacteria bacterium]